MAQWVKVFADNSYSLSSTHRTHIMNSYKLSSDLHLCEVAYGLLLPVPQL